MDIKSESKGASAPEKVTMLSKANTFISKKILSLAVMLMSFAVTNTAYAQAEFQEFQDAIEGFAGGPFAIGISVLALILGAIAGLAKLSAWPALVGFAIAAVFAIGPYIIAQIFTLFAL